MNLLLVNPMLFRDLATFSGTLPNMGLASLIASLKNRHVILLIDTTFHSDYRRYIRERLAGFRPDAVGFSCTSFNFKGSLEMAAFLRGIVPAGIPFIWGGVHPTLLPEETLSEPLVDAVCIGEGEVAMREYLDALERGSSPGGVAGVWYKAPGKGVVRNPLRPFIADIDALPPPAWEDFEMDEFLKAGPGRIPVLSSRGCPYHCTFCASPSIAKKIPGTYFRVKNPRLVVEEITRFRRKYPAVRRGPAHVYFLDETFGLDTRQFEGICGLFARDPRLADVTWGCETRADLVTEEWARTAARGHCVFVELGIESSDERILNGIYGKGLDRAVILRAVKLLRQFGIESFVLLMQGSYGETADSVAGNLRLLRDLSPLSFHVFTYHLTPGTPLYEASRAAAGLGAATAEEKNACPRSLPPRGVSLRHAAFKMLKLRLFLIHGIRLNKALFFPRVSLSILAWLFSLFRKSFTRRHFLSSLERDLLYSRIFAQRRPPR